MRFNGLDLNLLVALDALLGERSVTAAARRLNLSPSAVSCALARLREALGDDLLVTSGRRMVATPYAEGLAAEVRAILTRIDTTLRSEPQFDPARSSRHFRIVASDYVTDAVLATAICEICRLAPGVEIDLRPLVSDEVFADLQKGEIDLLIAPDRYRAKASAQQRLFEDRFVCLASADNGAVGKTITLDQYQRADHVVLKSHGAIAAVDDLFFSERGIARQVKISAPNFTLLPRLIVGSRRIATVPSRLADNYRRLLPLKIVKAKCEMPALCETMQWHQSRQNDKALTWLRQMIVATINSGN